MPASTVRYCAKGGTVTTPDRRVHFEQVHAGPPRQRLTFLDLTELLVVRELRETFNLSLRAIRTAQQYVQHELGEAWFLYQLSVYGRDIFISHIEEVPIAATRSGQMVLAGFFDDLLRRVQPDESGAPAYIYPRLADSHEPRPVQISPLVSFGYPTVAGTGIRTETVASRFDTGEEIPDIAQDDGLPIEPVEDAIRFQLAAA